MLVVVVGHVLIDLVGDDPEIVSLGNFEQGRQLLLCPDFAVWIAGRGYDDGLCPARDSGEDLAEVDFPSGTALENRDGDAARRRNEVGVVSIEGLE